MNGLVADEPQLINSKVRFSPELYEAIKRFSDRRPGRRLSFQSMIEQSLRMWMEVEEGNRPEFRAGMAAAATIFHDVVAEAIRRQLPQKQMYALRDTLERFVQGVDEEWLPKLAELAREAAAPPLPDDPAARYMLEVLDGTRNSPEEQALAEYLRKLSQR